MRSRPATEFLKKGNFANLPARLAVWAEDLLKTKVFGHCKDHFRIAGEGVVATSNRKPPLRMRAVPGRGMLHAS
jgi:hypothetical protein